MKSMGEFFSNVSRYPKFLITIVLGVFASAFGPLLNRAKNPLTAIAVVGALISGVITFYFVVKAMVFPLSIS